MLAGQQLRQFSTNTAFANAKRVFKKNDKPMRLKNKTVSRNSIEGKLSAHRPVQVARTTPKKFYGDGKRESLGDPSLNTPVLRVVRKEFM